MCDRHQWDCIICNILPVCITGVLKLGSVSTTQFDFILLINQNSDALILNFINWLDLSKPQLVKFCFQDNVTNSWHFKCDLIVHGWDYQTSHSCLKIISRTLTKQETYFSYKNYYTYNQLHRNLQITLKNTEHWAQMFFFQSNSKFS